MNSLPEEIWKKMINFIDEQSYLSGVSVRHALIEVNHEISNLVNRLFKPDNLIFLKNIQKFKMQSIKKILQDPENQIELDKCLLIFFNILLKEKIPDNIKLILKPNCFNKNKFNESSLPEDNQQPCLPFSGVIQQDDNFTKEFISFIIENKTLEEKSCKKILKWSFIKNDSKIVESILKQKKNFSIVNFKKILSDKKTIKLNSASLLYLQFIFSSSNYDKQVKSELLFCFIKFNFLDDLIELKINKKDKNILYLTSLELAVNEIKINSQEEDIYIENSSCALLNKIIKFWLKDAKIEEFHQADYFTKNYCKIEDVEKFMNKLETAFARRNLHLSPLNFGQYFKIKFNEDWIYDLMKNAFINNNIHLIIFLLQNKKNKL